jgi:hypothetical protein
LDLGPVLADDVVATSDGDREVARGGVEAEDGSRGA